MKKKIFIVMLIIVLLIGTFFVGRQVGLNSETKKTKVETRQEQVSTHDIKKTLTASGSVEAKTVEKLTLDTNKYFKTICVEEDDTVEANGNILQYTDGTYLVAPYKCVIKNVDVPESENKCASSNYIEITNLDTLTINISVNENEISNLAINQEVQIKLTANETKTYTGKITKIDSIGTYSSSGSTFNAIAEFENDGFVKLGMSASCTIILSEEKGAISVPIDSVSERANGEEYVTKVNDDGTTEEVTIKTGIADENYVQVLSGLNEGDIIQIETEITQDSTTSSSKSSKNSMMGDFGGEGRKSGSGDRQMPLGGSRTK